MKIKDSLRKIKKYFVRIFKKPYRKTYSQTGEDIIIDSVLRSLKIDMPSYLDIGANDPWVISNTAWFYKHGCRGITVEPNPRLYKRIMRKRSRDINLNVGIGPNGGSFPFYIMSSDTMSTFSKEEADKLVKEYGFKIERVIDVPIVSIQEIVDKYCKGKFPDFLTIDTEGMDYEILKSIDYSKNYPKVICAETREYGEGIEAGKHESDIEILLMANGYKIYANTYLNTIFYKR